MSAAIDLAKLKVIEFAERFRSEMIPLTNAVSYFSAVPLSEEETKDLLGDPIAALPPAFQAILPKLQVLLVPYLERANSKPGEEQVSFEQPAQDREALSAELIREESAVLVFSIKGQETAEYHYTLYRSLAGLGVRRISEEFEHRFQALLREELTNRIHGEVDERSWQSKQALLRRQSGFRRDTKLFKLYAEQSLIDTLTLYLHGICCDIDVETGPRQLQSRYLRRRLALLQELLPPPEGYAVFPEDLKS
jgi:hypothetical protein